MYLFFKSHITAGSDLFFSASLISQLKVVAGLLEVYFTSKIFVSKHFATSYLFFFSTFRLMQVEKKHTLLMLFVY